MINMQYPKIRDLFGNEKGVTLVMVLMVLMVLSVLGLGLLGVAVSNVKLTSVDRDYQATYYIAEAGATKVYSDIEKIVEEHYNDSENESAFYSELPKLESQEVIGDDEEEKFKSHFGELPTAIVEVTAGDDGKYTITSTGKIGKRQRTVKRSFTINWVAKGNPLNKMPENVAIFADSSLTFNGNIEVIGSIGTNSTEEGIITFNGSKSSVTNGSVFAPDENDEIVKGNKNANIPQVTKQKKYNLELFDFPVFPEGLIVQEKDLEIKNETVNIWKDKEFESIQITNDATIHTGDSDRRIVVDNLIIDDNSNLKIAGSGNLKLYVRNKVEIGGSSTINGEKSIGKFTLYLQGNLPANLTVGENVTIRGSFYIEDGTIGLPNNLDFQGPLLTKTSNINIDEVVAVSLLYAPNADVTLKANGQVEGAMIVKSLTASGQGNDATAIIYKEFDYSSSPFFNSEKAKPIEKTPISEVN